VNPNINPYAPGAGTLPPELAGRDEVLEAIQVTFRRLAAGNSIQPPVLYGLRGVGKTVLLLRAEETAGADGIAVIHVESSDSKSLPEMLAPGIRKALIELSLVRAASAQVKRAVGALMSLMSGFKVTFGEIGLSYTATTGIADTGNLEADLSDLLVELGKAAKSAGRVVAIFFDEMQVLRKHELSALIAALHRINHEKLPIAFVGAGLPQIVGLAAEAKSYAERLFRFVSIGPLAKPDAIAAIEQPARALGVSYAPEAITQILDNTQGYAYFLQQWGHDAWNVAQSDKTITWSDVSEATDIALRTLDESFFKARYDKCVIAEREYMRGMAELGPGAHSSEDIAKIIGGDPVEALNLCEQLTKKGMIYSSIEGLNFTVPLFDQFMKRAMPDFIAKSR
jgi:hypothetical protein